MQLSVSCGDHIVLGSFTIILLFSCSKTGRGKKGDGRGIDGSNVKLYDMTLQFLRTLFLRTRNVHYCTLRAELLMALHDLEVQDIISVDPCHKFTW